MLQKNLKKVKIKNEITDSLLLIFFYIPQAKRENIQPLIKFLQKHQLYLEHLQENFILNPVWNLIHNANFFVQSSRHFTNLELEHLAGFLFSHVTVISLFYHNQIWNLSRFEKLKNHPLLLEPFVNRLEKSAPFNTFKTHVYSWGKNLQRFSL